MKVVLLLLALFFFQLLSISIPCISVVDPTQLVHDTQGIHLSSDYNYYVLPANRGGNGGGGGLIHVRGGSRCLSFVAQENDGTLPGTPVIITPRNTSEVDDRAIRLSSDVFVEFNGLATLCAKRRDWHLADRTPDESASSSGKHQLVAAGNEEGTKSFGVFQIKKLDADDDKVGRYKLVSCVDDKMPCRDLGLFAYKGRTWLTISDGNPFIVVFQKAHSFVSY